MGICNSRVDREEIVSRCRARRRYMKQFVKARQAFSAAHSMYLRSLRGTGSALLQFANAETNLHHFPPRLPSPPPPPPMCPSSDNWTSVSASPPPPPPSSWDFWDPFAPSPSRPFTEVEWEDTITVSKVPVSLAQASVAAPPSVVSGSSKEATSELAMMVSRNTKEELVEIIKDVNDYFLKAAEAGAGVSLLLEASSSGFSNQTGDQGIIPSTSHCSTIERLYAWEKKLHQEVKNAESAKIEHENRMEQLRKQEVKGDDYVKIEKSKKEIEKLESRMAVASQAIETTSAEIIEVRETELYPQLVQLVKGLMCMWRGMYECHQVQTHIVQQLKFLNTVPTTDSTSDIHRQTALQLELEVQQWHLAFCNLIKTEQDYICPLTGWLRLSLFQLNNNLLTNTKQSSNIYSLCEEWQLALDRILDKVASEGIKSFLTEIHAVVVQQEGEQKQKKNSEAALKDLEKKVVELRLLERKYGTMHQDLVAEKRAKVEVLRVKAEEEKMKHEKLLSVSRAMTLNNLQMGLPHVLQAMTGFSSTCMHVFESVYNQPRSTDQGEDSKRILP